MYIPQFPVATF